MTSSSRQQSCKLPDILTKFIYPLLQLQRAEIRYWICWSINYKISHKMKHNTFNTAICSSHMISYAIRHKNQHYIYSNTIICAIENDYISPTDIIRFVTLLSQFTGYPFTYNTLSLGNRTNRSHSTRSHTHPACNEIS